MANDVANNMRYYLVLDKENMAHLANLRQWNLTIGFDQNHIWVKGLDFHELNSLEIRSIPYKTLYSESEGKLHLINSLLPDRNIPSLLWTPIERAIPVTLPAFNFNYFGVDQKVPISLVPSEAEVEAVAMTTRFKTFRAYIETAPAVRLKNLAWCILNNDKVFLLGKPLLPVTGNVYWKRYNCLIPAGYDFDFYLLSDSLNNLLNPENSCWIIWDVNNSYSLIEKDQLEPLSIGSFRLTVQRFILSNA